MALRAFFRPTLWIRACRHGRRPRSSIRRFRTEPVSRGSRATRPRSCRHSTTSTSRIQRQFTCPTLVAEVGYNGVLASRLESLNRCSITKSIRRYLTAFGTVAQSITVLNSLVGSPTADAAGITAPFPGFNALWGSRATVAQALRPYPQYTYIDTYAGQGDHSGHSTYHAMIVKFTKRVSSGLTFQTSYVLSKILTDSDTAWGPRPRRRPGLRACQPGPGEIDRPVRRDSTISSCSGRLRSAVSAKGKRYLQSVRPDGCSAIGVCPAFERLR